VRSLLNVEVNKLQRRFSSTATKESERESKRERGGLVFKDQLCSIHTTVHAFFNTITCYSLLKP
jgi:hypothetical protein